WLGLHSEGPQGSLRRVVHVGRLPRDGARAADFPDGRGKILHVLLRGRAFCWTAELGAPSLIEGGTRCPQRVGLMAQKAHWGNALHFGRRAQRSRPITILLVLGQQLAQRRVEVVVLQDKS